ncbi:MAG: helix-turn-helix domain-containing protein [Porticoccaceae bacterium]|nr:helix-turn-helix domain-containing protein [Porticoccaceae bacterium]MDG1310955.1 helix-turn-helix domain-containing protein [Porticoccaceae bacterium]
MHAAKFVESYIDAWNHSDPKGVAEHLVKNGIYCDIPANQQHSGEALVAILSDFFASGSHRYHLIGDVLSNDLSIAFQYRMSSLDGIADDWFGAEFMTLKGSGAIKIADYYDPTHSVGSMAVGASSLPLQKYAKSGLDEEQLQRYTSQLASLMRDEKVFLQPDLTLPKLAAMVGCSVNHLSQAVNSGFHMSFFDFLNSYRIEAAKIMLSLGDGRSESILDVSFAVGFNSNSAFYTAFKKSTGQTPAQFRRAFLKPI